ncbi:class I SAM-dependent methyltransferase [Treponema primitia]|uniref:class I SAM-dependent methyltransferase n=1 Tax=Treponema primitia TaxID=88058 RepID=UPI0002555096|nr:class I SAM-dependent methyltransferase [Treponema primitia]
MEKLDFFNDIAEKWDSTSHYDMDKIELLIKLLYIKNGDAVLDVGTGTGVLIPILLKLTGNITAIDSAEKMIELAHKKFAHTEVNFIHGDVLEYPFDDGAFDHIICYSVFPHFDDKPLAISRLAKKLKPGGLLSILHSASKEKINGIHVHAHNRDIMADNLPPAQGLISCAQNCGLREEIIIDNSEMYLFGARRKWQV